MKILVERKELLSSLQHVQGIVEKRTTMPILSNVLMETVKGGISLSATDLEIGLKGFFPCNVQDDGKITLSAKKLYDIVRELPEGEVTLYTEENHWVVIKSGKSHFKMKGLSPEDFPSLPSLEDKKSFQLDEDLLDDLIKRTFFSSGEGDTRQILNGIWVGILKEGSKTKIRFVGTDGHRLALAERPIDPVSLKDRGELYQMVIPKKAVLELRRLIEGKGKVKVFLMQNQVGFEIGQVLLFSRLLEGTYPNYQQVIPPECEHAVRISRSDFEGVLRRVALFSREKTNAVVMDVSQGKALLSSRDPDIGEAKEEISIEYEGAKTTVGFNARYILEVLSAMDEGTIVLEIQNALSPCLLRQKEGRDCLWVVMPLRLQEL